MSRRAWLAALALALAAALAAMIVLKMNTDPGPGEPGGPGNLALTLGGILVLLAFAAISARGGSRGGGDRDDG